MTKQDIVALAAFFTTFFCISVANKYWIEELQTENVNLQQRIVKLEDRVDYLHNLHVSLKLEKI